MQEYFYTSARVTSYDRPWSRQTTVPGLTDHFQNQIKDAKIHQEPQLQNLPFGHTTSLPSADSVNTLAIDEDSSGEVTSNPESLQGHCWIMDTYFEFFS